MAKEGGFFSPNRKVSGKDKQVASSMSAGSYGGYVDAGENRGFVSKEQAESMLANPERYKMRPSEIRYLRDSMPFQDKVQAKPFFSQEVGQIASATSDLSGLMASKLPSDYKETESQVNFENMLRKNFDDPDSMDYGIKQMIKEGFQRPDGTYDSPVRFQNNLINKAFTDTKIAQASDFDKEGYDSFLKKDFGVDSDSSIYKSFPNNIKFDLRQQYKDNNKLKYKDSSFAPTDTKVALGGDNLGGYGALGIAGSIFGLGLKGIQSAIEGGKRLKENIDRRVNPEKNQVSIGDRVGGFLNSMMGISPVAAGTLDAQPKQVGYQPVGPKLNYVNPDAKTMSLKQIGEAFKPSNLFGYKDKYGKYDDPGSPLDRQRQETMQRVYNRFTRPMTPDARTIGQIRADQEATMRDNARLRYQNFQDRRALGPAANIQKTFGADSTYGTGVPSNPAMGFSGKMDADAQAKYAKAAREATAGAQTDPSLGNVFTQTYNRIASRFGLPQKNLQTVDQRQLKKAQEAYNRPRVQQEAYARKMLGITNDMVKADNMQRIRLNAFARNQAFKAERAQKAAERAARRLGGNIGTGRDGGFGTGTEGKGLPSNPKGFSGYSRRKSSPGTGTGTGTSTSTSKSGISKSRSRGQGPGSSSSRSKGGTGTGKSGQGSKSSARGAKGSSSSRSKGGVSKGGTRGSVGRGGRRGGRRCDIRTKIDITSLTNQNLMRDDLATVAYFVQELKGE